MITLKGKHIYLRALELEDLDFIFEIENNESVWEVSNTQTPYSRFLIKKYLQNANKDIYEVKQLRLVISDYDNKSLGLVDIFECDFKNSRAGLGLLINDPSDRGKGYGKEAIALIINYCFSHLNMHQLYCNISEDNNHSINLFTSLGFKKVGVKKDWNYVFGFYKDELLFQLIKNEYVH